MQHIARRHPEMAGEADRILETISMPGYVQEGDAGTRVAVKHYTKTPLTEKWCAVVYRGLSDVDGFVATAYLPRQPAKGRRVVWKP